MDRDLVDYAFCPWIGASVEGVRNSPKSSKSFLLMQEGVEELAQRMTTKQWLMR